MSKKYGLFVSLLTIVMMLSLFSLVTYAAGEKDTLIIGIQDDVVSLDPAKAYENVSLGMTGQLLYEKLVNFKENDFTQPVPELAESWEIGEDGKTWMFHIRKGVSFASGNPVTADSVVFSLRRAIKIAGEPSWLLTQFGITEESITKTDEDTVQIVLDQQYASLLFLSCLTFNVASVLDQNVVMEHEQDGDMGSAWLDTHSAGTGPFTLEERKQGESYVLKANEQYWRDKPPVKQIIIRNVKEPIEQAIMLEKGEIDIAWNLQPDQVKRLETNPDIQVYGTPILTTVHFAMNLGYAPLKKAEVRDAIRYAIDYEGIVDLILQGAAVKIQTFIPKGMLGYNPAMPYSRDLEKAKQLLTDAGYPDGFDVELICLDYSPWTDVALKIKSDLKAVGINVKIMQKPVSEVYNAYIFRDFQLHLWQWQPDYVDPDCNAKAFAHSDSAGDDATIKLVAWFCRYVNLETSKLVKQAALEADNEKREAIYKKITDIILDDGPFAILYVPKKQYAIRLEARDFIGIPSVIWSNFPVLR